MNEIYHYIGMILIWISAILGAMLVFGFIVKLILNELGKHFSILWRMLEYVIYRKEFKEWVKDKERIKKAV